MLSWNPKEVVPQVFETGFKPVSFFFKYILMVTLHVDTVVTKKKFWIRETLLAKNLCDNILAVKSSDQIEWLIFAAKSK